ncbi:MAG: phosphoribosylanthranilate isomerase [Phycisphaerales bacterium]|nr:phosphoribosylanthranilate isomerase [Phycisphaerales bacterium]
MTPWRQPEAPLSTRIKICGIQDPDMALIAVDAGASAIGLVSHKASPRHLESVEIQTIMNELPEDVPAVQVFVDPTAETMSQVQGWIQLHGEESEQVVAQARGPVVRGISFSPEAVRRWNACSSVDLLLIDGPGKGAGRTFDHDQLLELQSEISKPIVLAGGLDPDTVGDAITALRPWGVDVSSGVESGRGIKDPARIRAFCEAVRAADSISN